MAAGSTYTPIATTTLGSATASYTFSSIAGTYTDLILIVNGTSTVGDGGLNIRFNSDTGSNYSRTALYADGSSAYSQRNTNGTFMWLGRISDVQTTSIIQIMNYANTTTYKTALGRGNSTNSYLNANVGLWRNTSAITSVTAYPESGSFGTGTTLTLYGIAAA